MDRGDRRVVQRESEELIRPRRRSIIARRRVQVFKSHSRRALLGHLRLVEPDGRTVEAIRRLLAADRELHRSDRTHHRDRRGTVRSMPASGPRDNAGRAGTAGDSRRHGYGFPRRALRSDCPSSWRSPRSSTSARDLRPLRQPCQSQPAADRGHCPRATTPHDHGRRPGVV